MRRALAFMILFAAGCNSDPVADCDLSPRTDCCVNDRECLDFFGSEFPYCNEPGRNTGTCSECITNADCVGSEFGPTCVIDSDDVGLCTQ